MGPNPEDLWMNRRRFAYGAGLCMVIIMLAAIFKELSDANADLLGNLAYAFAAIIGAYLGFVVMDDASKRKTRARVTEAGSLSEEDKALARQPAVEGD